MDIWPIEWPTDVDPTTLDPALVQWAELSAANVLRFLTLYRVGGSPITVLPCGSTCGSYRAGFHPYLTDNGMYANCWCSSACSCGDLEGVVLEAPVGEVLQVTIDEVVVPPDSYHVIDGSVLVRTEGRWPSCGNKMKVTYQNGYKVDLQGRAVGGLLANEFVKSRTDEKKCRLPRNITNITRSGVTMEFQTGMFPDMLTGIKEVDTYLVQFNPNKRRQAPGIFSPDMDKPKVITWP